METEKKKRSRKTFADRLAEIDARIQAADEHLAKLHDRRAGLVVEAQAKIRAMSEELKRANSASVPE